VRIERKLAEMTRLPPCRKGEVSLCMRRKRKNDITYPLESDRNGGSDTANLERDELDGRVGDGTEGRSIAHNEDAD
jgi:hypothetical protein